MKRINNRGITLIALVITIIVLLILAGVTISTLTGENGILTRATEASEKNQISADIEKIKLVCSEAQIEENTDGEEITRDKLSEIAQKNYPDEQIIINGKREDEEYPYIVSIGDKDYGITSQNDVVYLEPKIQNQYITITHVKDNTPKYELRNTISQERIDNEVGKKNINYEVLGVSNAEDGTYVKEGSIEGKSGSLNIINIENGDYEYQLENLLQGDETFYVKMQIDGEEKIQEIKVIQGNTVRYEENFEGIKLSEEWQTVTNENYSNGTSVVVTNYGPTMSLDYYGSGFRYITETTEVHQWFVYENWTPREDKDYNNDNRLNVRIFAAGLDANEPPLYQQPIVECKHSQSDFYHTEITASPSLGPADAQTGKWYFDAIEIDR